MALSVDWPNRIITVPQADLTLVSGTLYTMNTETYFRTNLMALAATDPGIAYPYPLRHNTEVTVAGVTYARTIELINNYQIQFTPNSQWTVRLEGSNNNLFDVENNVLVQNQVQVIPTNSAGLQTAGSAMTSEQNTRLQEVWQMLGLDGTKPVTHEDDKISIGGSPSDITIDVTGDGETSSTLTRQ